MANFRGYKRQIQLSFDYSEVKKGIPNVSKQMSILNADFKKTYEEAKASGKEIDKLGARYDFLSNKVKIQSQDVENYAKKLEEAKNAQGNNTKAIENATTSLEIAKSKLGQTEAQLDQVTQELEKQRLTLGKTSEEWGELGKKTTDLGKDMTLKLTTPILAAAGASFKLGADFEQSIGKMEVVFERNSASVEKWAQNALRDFGLAKSTAIEMAGDFGALFKGMGMNMKQTEEWSTTLTERTMDLANFYDTTVSETTNALNAIVTGQTEPLRKFGINMTQAALGEYALSKGIRKKISDMTEAEKVQLRYNFVIDKTNIAVGTTARESDTATGQMNRFKEVVKELGVSFSDHIIPLFVPVIEGLSNLMEKFAGLSDGTKKFIVTIGGIIAAVGPVLIVLGSVFKAISNISEGMKAAKTGMDAVGKAGSAISGVLSATGSWGFKEWAIAIAGIVALLTILIALMDAVFNKGRGMQRVISNLGGVLPTSVNNANQRGRNVGRQYVDGSHRLGLDRVPKDGYIAELHKNEEVLRADDPRNQNNSKGNGDTINVYVQADELQQMSDVVRLFSNLKQTSRQEGY